MRFFAPFSYTAAADFGREQDFSCDIRKTQLKNETKLHRANPLLHVLWGYAENICAGLHSYFF